MQEGIILCFHQEQLVDQTYTIPIYLVEESGLKNSHLSLKEDYQVATLRYFANKKEWQLELDQDDIPAFGFMDEKMTCSPILILENKSFFTQSDLNNSPVQIPLGMFDKQLVR